DDLVDRLALGAKRDPDEVELSRGDGRDGGAIRLVVTRREELGGVHGRDDSTAHRPVVGAAKAGSVRLVDEHGLHEHRQVLVAGRVAVRLADDAGHRPRDPAHEEGGDVRLLPDREGVAEDDWDLRRECGLHRARVGWRTMDDLRSVPFATLVVAAGQARCAALDVGANVAVAADLVRHAAGEGADLLVLPELFLTGYELEAI